MGSKGRMFDVQESAPSPEELFSLPVILELGDLSLEDQALLGMFVLTFLHEYRELNPGRPGRVKARHGG